MSELREEIILILDTSRYTDCFGELEVEKAADAILNLINTEGQAGDVGGLDAIKALIDFESECDAELDDRPGAGKTVFVEDIMDEKLCEMGLDRPFDIVRHFADPIRTALARSAPGWRDMDSAPKDGTMFLAYIRHNVGGAERWSVAWAPSHLNENSRCAWWVTQSDVGCPIVETHRSVENCWIMEAWQPLPAPPASNSGEGE